MPTFHQFQNFIRKPKLANNRRKDLQKCPQKKGICWRIYETTPRKPNSARRKVARVILTNKKRVMVYIPGQKHSLQKYSTVLVRGGRATDVPGSKYKVIRGVYDLHPLPNCFNARSKYGVKKILK